MALFYQDAAPPVLPTRAVQPSPSRSKKENPRKSESSWDFSVSSGRFFPPGPVATSPCARSDHSSHRSPSGRRCRAPAPYSRGWPGQHPARATAQGLGADRALQRAQRAARLIVLRYDIGGGDQRFFTVLVRVADILLAEGNSSVVLNDAVCGSTVAPSAPTRAKLFSPSCIRSCHWFVE